MQRTPSRKKPCRACGQWFVPHPRVKERQMTCGDPECRRKWHNKKCAEWNRKNQDYFKENYLQKKLDAAAEQASEKSEGRPVCHLKSRFRTGLPLLFVQEAISAQHVVIIEYMAQLLSMRFKEVIRAQVPVNT